MRVQSIEVPFGTDLGVIERSVQFVIRNLHAAAAMRAARRQQAGLVGPKLRRRADVTMTIDNHATSSPL